MNNSYTQVPNMVLDQYLPSLTGSEIKILLVIIRQTYGWIDKRTGYRKKKDRITNSQFVNRTGMSKRVISQSLQSLLTKRLILVTDFKGRDLSESLIRKGRLDIMYSLNSDPEQKQLLTSAQKLFEPVQKSDIYKRKEINRTKERVGVEVSTKRLSDILNKT